MTYSSWSVRLGLNFGGTNRYKNKIHIEQRLVHDFSNFLFIQNLLF